jgi:hypothetical protein
MFFAFVYNERALDDLCYAYWLKYLKALSRSRDGYLLLEQSIINTYRSLWEGENLRIRWLRRSGQFVTHYDVFSLATRWMAKHDSVHAMDLK